MFFKQRLLSLLGCLILITPFAMSSCSSPAPRRDYPVYLLETEPVVDGVVESDPAWSSIPQERTFVTPVVEEFQAPFPAGKQTLFKMGHTATHLYLAVEAIEPWTRYIGAPLEAEDPFRKDDGIELLIAPEAGATAHHFVVNATGSRWSGTIEGEETTLDDWDAQSVVAEDRIWVELRIPFEKLGATPTPGAAWLGNIIRNTVSIMSPEDWKTSWSPVDGSFDDPAGFGEFVFSNEHVSREDLQAIETRFAARSEALLKLEEQVLTNIQEREDKLAASYEKQVRASGIGFTGVTRDPVDLIEPPDTPAGEVWRYGLGFPIQVSPTEAVLLTNVRMEGTGNIDFEIGTDAVLFDDLTDIKAENAIPVSRFERLTDPVEGDLIVRKGPVIAGFVPLGALLEDGSPHPHAGTGFGINWAISHRIDPGGKFEYTEFVERYAVMSQFTYDGERFHIADQNRIDAATILPGWNLVGNFVTNGIPDDQDMLYVMIARVGEVSVAGYTRWSRGPDGWRPVAFTPVTGYDVTWSEPSLVRDTDGNLLLSARSYDPARPVIAFDIAVWRSTDNGDTWNQVINEKNRRARSPVSINRTLDGTAFVAANTPALRRTREVLSIWPIDAAGTRLEGRITARDAKAEFGPAPSGSWWRIDHPNSAILRLADEQLHSVISYRIVDNGEVEGNAPPAPQTGCYVEEVFSAGPPSPVWRFDTAVTP